MTIVHRTVFSRTSLNLLLCVVLLAVGCAARNGSGPGSRSNRRAPAQEPAPSQRPENQARGGGEQGGTELWLFGASDADLTDPFDARGVRVIVDMRTIKTQQSIAFLRSLANKNLGVAICLRWKNSRHEGDRARGRENFDVPPTAQEASRALSQLREILGSEPAKQIGERFYIGIYNEIGGGPGRYDLSDADEMLAFANRLVPIIREANPKIRISGPAISGGQLAQYGKETQKAANVGKAELIEQWIEWSARNADVQDVHLNGIDVDPSWADDCLTTMRRILDAHGGQHVGLVSFEWSCSGYGQRENAAGIRQYIKDVWATLNRHNVQVAAYTYWPLFGMPLEMQSKTSWASVIGPDRKPNEAVWETLEDIGKKK